MQIKKIITFLLLLLITGSITAQRVKRKGVNSIDISKNKRPGTKQEPEFSTTQLVGKWQEVYRTDKNSIPAGFTDTIYLNFLSANKVITRDGNSMNMAGDAMIESGNILQAAADTYTIISIADSQLVLDNQDNLIHTFKKTEEFIFDTYGKNPVKKEDFTDPVPVSMADVKGNWMVYRKVAKPGAINPPVNIIQYLKITDSTGENTAKGVITFYQTNKSTELPCTIKITNAGLDITSGDFSWSLFAYKADKKELVFGDAAVLLYYAKSF
ncbi:MAG: hypothetical protein IPP72_07480 [Chitinophagaceae bacterium]|nr:hypothetical protein [Chitinophagaceae bacterium]